MFTKEKKETQTTPEWITALPGNKLVKEPLCRHAIENLSALVPLSKNDFEQFYVATIKKFAETIQNLPATRYAYYSQPFGLLQLGLDRAIISVRLALKSFEDFEGRKSDQLSALDQAEVFAVFAAALLSDIGVLPLRFAIKVTSQDKLLRNFDPYASTIYDQGSGFTFEFNQPELSSWPAPASLVLASRTLSGTSGTYHDSAFAWLSQHHVILQFWYNLMLQLSPAQEESTRRRYMYALIPGAENELIEKFLDEHFPYRGGIDKKKTLFSQYDDVDSKLASLITPDEQEEIAKPTLPRDAVSYERVFGGSGITDATNARILGSAAAQNTPNLRYGLAFIGWLRALARSGRLSMIGSQTDFLHVMDGDKVSVDWHKASQVFAQEQLKHGVSVSAHDILKDLRDSQLLKQQDLQLRQFAFYSKASASFTGITLPAQLIFGDEKRPPVRLLTEVPVGPLEAPKEKIHAQPNVIFKPKL